MENERTEPPVRYVVVSTQCSYIAADITSDFRQLLLFRNANYVPEAQQGAHIVGAENQIMAADLEIVPPTPSEQRQSPRGAPTSVHSSDERTGSPFRGVERLDSIESSVFDSTSSKYMSQNYRRAAGASYVLAMGVCGIVLVALSSSLKDLAEQVDRTSIEASDEFAFFRREENTACARSTYYTIISIKPVVSVVHFENASTRRKSRIRGPGALIVALLLKYRESFHLLRVRLARTYTSAPTRHPHPCAHVLCICDMDTFLNSTFAWLSDRKRSWFDRWPTAVAVAGDSRPGEQL